MVHTKYSVGIKYLCSDRFKKVHLRHARKQKKFIYIIQLSFFFLLKSVYLFISQHKKVSYFDS